MADYALKGPQVEPDASYWMFCPHPCVIHIDDLRKVTDNPKDPNYFPPYPTVPKIVKAEFAELLDLAAKRDDPCALVDTGPCKKAKLPETCMPQKALPNAIGCRRPISRFLNIVPPALGAVMMNRFPGEQIIRTGRGLARAVESETPGLFHRHALNYLLRLRNWSPPRQALVWAALDVAIASALQAAWYYKWLATGRTDTARRQRPIEYAKIDVLFDRPDELNPAYNLCPDGRPHGGTWPNNASGTPRHPAYPSGHSTYAGAASEIISFFFGEQKTPDDLPFDPRLSIQNTSIKDEMDNLADNIGMGRLWAGIHWRSDHEAGLKLGRTVACMVLQQLADIGKVACMDSGKGVFKPGKVTGFDLCTGLPDDVDQCNFKDGVKNCDPKEMPPSRAQLECEAQAIAKACGETKKLEGPCPGPEKGKENTSLDRGRGVQQNQR